MKILASIHTTYHRLILPYCNIQLTKLYKWVPNCNALARAITEAIYNIYKREIITI